MVLVGLKPSSLECLQELTGATVNYRASVYVSELGCEAWIISFEVLINVKIIASAS